MNENTLKILNINTIDKLRTLQIDGEPDLINELITTFFISASNYIADFEKHALAKNHIEASKVAHAFKSSSRTLGAEHLGELCQELEDQYKNSVSLELTQKHIDSLKLQFHLVEHELKKLIS